MDQYQEFVDKLLKRGSKPYKFSHCLGSRDAFNWVRKNHWEATGGQMVDKLLYSQIISEVHRILVEQLLEGHEIVFPYQMGSLLLNRTPARVYYEDGELKNNYKTDWKKTLEYRFNEDPEGHLRVKRVQPYIYSVRYYKRKARYHNQHFYLFRANRSLSRTLGAAVERGKVNVEQLEM